MTAHVWKERRWRLGVGVVCDDEPILGKKGQARQGKAMQGRARQGKARRNLRKSEMK